MAALTLTVAMAATLSSLLGHSLWHYNVGFAGAVLAALAAWPLWSVRRFTTLTLAASGALATATGGVMLYTTEFAYKEWITWWHSWTSFVFTLAFLAHWFNNSKRLKGFTVRLLTRERFAGYPAAVAWLVLVGLGVWTGTSGVRAGFTRGNYLYLSTWAVLVGVAFTYGIWLLYRAPSKRRALAQVGPRNRARALVDTSLFLANWAALLTGFALLYFADFLRAGDFKYVSKWWHTAASVALLAFVTLHIGFNARLLAAHARRVDDELSGGDRS